MEEVIGFEVPVWSWSIGTPKEEQVEISLKVVLAVVSAGALAMSRVKVKRVKVFLEIIKDRRKFV